MITDIVWSRIAFRTFLYGKTWFILTLVVFIAAQSVLNHLSDYEGDGTENEDGLGLRIAIFVCRLFVYMFSMCPWIYFHLKHTIRACKQRDFAR